MAATDKKIIAIVLLLKQQKTIDLASVQHAADQAFRGAPVPPKVIPGPRPDSFGIVLGPLRLGLINAAQPYFKDVAAAANRVRDFAGKQAIQQHAAWLSVDLMGDPPPLDESKIYGIVGSLIAEFLNDDVLGVLRLPAGPVIGYDFSFIPLFRNRRADDVFKSGTPDRLVKATANDNDLKAATAEAKRRWPEFVTAFANRKPGQGFGVKKKFVEGEKVEHMWVEVLKIAEDTIHGKLSNQPRNITSLKLGDPVLLSEADVNDWIYTNGKENVGGFSVNVLKRKQ